MLYICVYSVHVYMHMYVYLSISREGSHWQLPSTGQWGAKAAQSLHDLSCCLTGNHLATF